MIRLTRTLSACLMCLLLIAVAPTAQSRDGVGILLGRARALEASGRMDLAAQNWNQVLLADPNQPEALAGLARHAKLNGDARTEQMYVDRLRKLDPRSPAIVAIEKMRIPSEQERARLDEAGRLAADRQADRALKIYRDIFGNEPPPGKWAEAFYEVLSASTGGRQEAIARLRALCARDPDNEVHRLWLARILTYDSSTRTEGFRLLESIMDSGPVEQAQTAWRRALLWEKNNPAVQASLESYLQRYPDEELNAIVKQLHEIRDRAIHDAEKQHGFEALRSGNIGMAQQRFDAALRRSPNDADALAGLGFVRLDQRRFEDALRLLEKARALAPGRPEVREGRDTARYWLAMQEGARLKERDAEAAIAAYQTALSIRPREERPIIELALLLLQRGDLPGAAARFQTVITQAPNNVEAIVGLGFVRQREENFDAAASLFAKARNLAPDRSDIEEAHRSATFWGVMKQAAAALTEQRAEEALAGFQRALLLNPVSTDALAGLAGAAGRLGMHADATAAYARLIEIDSTHTRAWFGQIKTRVDANDPVAALESMQRLPATVKEELELRSDYLSLVSLALFTTGRKTESRRALELAIEIAARDDTDEALDFRLQLANLLRESGDLERAIAVYKQATELHPNNAIAWQGLIGGYAASRDFPAATTALRSMPRDAYEVAAGNTGFLNGVAAVYAAEGRCVAAERLLKRSLELDKSAGRGISQNTQLQLADVWMREGRHTEARQAYREMINSNPNSDKAWRGYISALHQARLPRTLLMEWSQIPAAARAQLENEPDILSLLANAHATEGQDTRAVELLEQARSIHRSNAQSTPANLDLQLGWALLSTSRHVDLAELLKRLRARTDLTDAQRHGISELLSTWSRRRAEAAMQQGKPAQAIEILTEAIRLVPDDPRIPATLASVHLRLGANDRAVAVYRSWGMAGAGPDDYRAAAGAALALPNTPLAMRFLRDGLQRFPTDRELLHMTGRQAIAQGKYEEGERLLRAALEGTTSAQVNRDTGVGSVRLQPNVPQSSAGQCRDDAAEANPYRSGLRLINVSYVFTNRTTRANDLVPTSQSQDPRRAQEIQDDLDFLKHRNTPYVGFGATTTSRSGDTAISRLVVRDGGPGGSITFADRVRVGIDAHAVSLRSGADGRAGQPFGTLPSETQVTEQSAFGTGTEFQISTRTLGLAFGRSPKGFLTDTWTAGVRIGVPNGPFTVMAVRENVKDSIVSYAGARDPGTGTVWGGVTSNSISLRFLDDVAGDGTYFFVRAGRLRGVNVKDNWNVEGSAGTYWGLPLGRQGWITAGVNLTGMHYARNLNFFSLGHGGYFSPWLYALASIPVTMSARHHRVSYEISASPGVQYVKEAAAPLHPAQLNAPLYYAAQERRAPNYSASLRVDYRITPHWHLGAFADLNNTRGFVSRTAGMSLKLLTLRLPPRTNLDVNSVPDWRGNLPLGR